MAKFLTNAQKALYEMKSLLLNNENIRKILVYDQPDALEQAAPDISQASKHITFFPISEVGITNYTENTLMTITCSVVDPETDSEDDGSVYLGYIITVITTKNLWELKNYKIRLLELISEITETLNGYKCSLPIPLTVLKAEDVVFDGSHAGYVLKIDTQDLQKSVSL